MQVGKLVRRTTFLSENNRSLLQLALEIAREKFRENAKTLRNAKIGMPMGVVIGYERLAETFDQQNEDAQTLLNLISSADEVTIIKEEN